MPIDELDPTVKKGKGTGDDGGFIGSTKGKSIVIGIAFAGLLIFLATLI